MAMATASSSASSRAVSKTFWAPLHEPRAFDRYDTLWQIAKDLRRGASCKSSKNITMTYFLCFPNVKLPFHACV
jgi:hypothetical protein